VFDKGVPGCFHLARSFAGITLGVSKFLIRVMAGNSVAPIYPYFFKLLFFFDTKILTLLLKQYVFNPKF